MTTYKTILAHAGPPFEASVGRVAVQLAQVFDARLVAVACSGIELLLAPGLIEAGNETLARHLMDEIDAASGALEQVREMASKCGITAETRRLNRPVLVVPDSYAGATCGVRVLLAWECSAAAARAVSAALPLLARADMVEAITYSTDDGFNVQGEIDALAAFPFFPWRACTHALSACPPQCRYWRSHAEPCPVVRRRHAGSGRLWPFPLARASSGKCFHHRHARHADAGAVLPLGGRSVYTDFLRFRLLDTRNSHAQYALLPPDCPLGQPSVF